MQRRMNIVGKKKECCSSLNAQDLQVVSVEENELFRVFHNYYSYILASRYNTRQVVVF